MQIDTREARQKATDFNNLGVDFFLHHQLEDAAVMFEGAIEELAKVMDVMASSAAANSNPPWKESKASLLYRRVYEPTTFSLPMFSEGNGEMLVVPSSPPTSSSSSSFPSVSYIQRRGGREDLRKAAKAYLLKRVRSQQDPNLRSSMITNVFRMVNETNTTTLNNDNDHDMNTSDDDMHTTSSHHHENNIFVPNEAEMCIMAGISSFNLGLCHHIMSTPSVAMMEENKKSLEHASIMYFLAYKLAMPLAETHTMQQQQQQQQQQQHHYQNIPDRLIMASLNNLALLHYEVGEYDKSQHVLDVFVSFLREQQESMTTYRNNCDEDFRKHRALCLLNTMLLKPPISAASA